MKLTDDKYMALAEMYLFAGIGQKVSGLIHNLNNHVHAADMQLAMLVSKSDSSGDKPLADFKDRLARAAGGTSALAEILNQISWFSFYTQKTETQISIQEYFNWLLKFWDNDLFFKHKISCEPIIESPGWNIKITPFHLTSCLEQAIQNVVEACQGPEAEGAHKMQIRAFAVEKGVSLAVKSFTRFPDLDPWVEGSTSRPGRLGMGLPLCAWLAGRMNWDIKLHRGTAETELIVSIPG
jgi:hypothetical protein